MWPFERRKKHLQREQFCQKFQQERLRPKLRQQATVRQKSTAPSSPKKRNNQR